MKIKSEGFKMIAYADDDVVILIIGKYHPTISDLMESALAKVYGWLEKNDLGVNLGKIEIVFLTRKQNPEFHRSKYKRNGFEAQRRQSSWVSFWTTSFPGRGTRKER